MSSILSRCGVHRVAFADDLKRVAMDLWDLSFEQVYGGDDVREVIDERWNLTPRQILQLFGTEIGRSIHIDTWVRKTLRIINDAHKGSTVTLPDFQMQCFSNIQFAAGQADMWAVPDCRFPSEAAAIRAANGVVIKVERPSLVSTDMHASETEVDNVIGDYQIINDGSLDDLRRSVLSVFDQILTVRNRTQ